MQESVKQNSKFDDPKLQERLSVLLQVFRRETFLLIFLGNVKLSVLLVHVFQKKPC